jgi:pimeloyl-ACP methyl ester carboxylesterase
MQLIQTTSNATLTERHVQQLSWLDRRLYPFASRQFATPDGVLHYIDEGHGRPILFVHGTPSWSFEWRHALTALRQETRTIAVDHLGFGLSDKPRDAGYKPQDHARRLLEFVRALDLRELTLVVHDFGGPDRSPRFARGARAHAHFPQEEAPEEVLAALREALAD